jgi:cytochrome c-type biogenesis protein CcmH
LSKETGLKVLAALLVAFLFAAQLATGPVWAAGAQPEEDTYVQPLADPVLEARAKALQRELRCLVCQGQSIDESNAPLAADLRRLIRQQIQGGQSDNDIKSFLVARYGAFVLMKPPVRDDTFFLWFGPAMLVLVGAGVIGVTISRSRRRLGNDGESELSLDIPEST